MGYGLLDRTMIHRLTEQWHYGGIGVIVVHVSGNTSASVLEALTEWMNEQRRLVWRYRMENDFFYFLQRGKSEDKLDKLIKRAVDALRSKLKRIYAGEEELSATHADRSAFAIGHASAYPSSIGRSAEATIYYAIKDAISAVMRYRIRQEDAAAVLDSPAGAETDTWGGLALDESRISGTGGQGRQIAQPAAVPSSAKTPFPIGMLAKSIPTLSPSERVSDLARMFESNPHVQGAIIASEGRPIGLIMKENMNQLLAGQFGLPLYWNRSVSKIMDEEALVVEADLPVEHVAQLAMARDISRLYHVVIITRGGKLIGAASIRAILECMTQLRTEEARTANPLTGLPGNAAILREMQSRIDTGKKFAIIYADLDYFKWFNDCFGFSRGDELIRFLSAVLQEVASLSGAKDDFIGHIGGDDFIVLSDAEDAEQLCRHMITRFNDGARAYYGGVDVSSVMDRSGNTVIQDGVTLSLSLLTWDGLQVVTTADISEAAARLKKQAKSITGSAYVAGDVFEKHLGEGKTT
ncbi:GGDEF domain-containing protein [Paenibacillus sp. R14(2021)]|uniref:GGDEF domain-containing protein n=1 Tax=Paenibacillus sp. R14(2021) TaxID=2859228 RepID=UPI0021580A7D|nr:GGDEF domain-containing protein [Paenibacillus sp. R14(2021)]